MKILILGAPQHGKTSAAEYIAKRCNLRCHDEHYYAREIILKNIYEEGNPYGLPLYDNEEDCFIDRVNYRAEWKQIISDVNKENKSELPERVYEEYDFYVGIRRFEEYASLTQKGIVDLTIAIDASKRKGDQTDVEIPLGCADIYVDNNSTKKAFYRNLDAVIEFITLVKNDVVPFSKERLDSLLFLHAIELVPPLHVVREAIENIVKRTLSSGSI